MLSGLLYVTMFEFFLRVQFLLVNVHTLFLLLEKDCVYIVL